MIAKPKPNPSLLPSKDISLAHLAKLNSYLDSEHVRAKYVNKEIKNQIQMAKKNEGTINKTINDINSNGEEFVRRYQEEREKCQKLEFLVGHIEEQIYQMKMDKANDLKNNIEIDRIAQMTEILNQKQKELEKVSQKSNTSSYDISKKLDTIRALRSERTIVSELFDKIQRELCNLEHCYKVLVIERKKEEKQLEKTVAEFNQCQTTGERELAKMKDKCSKLQQGLIHTKAKINTLNTETEVKEDNSNRMSIFNQKSSGELKVIPSQRQHRERDVLKEKTHKYLNDLSKLDCQRKVKQVINSLGISSIKDLPTDIQSLEFINSSLLKESDKLYEAIFKLETDLQQLNRSLKYSPPQTQRKMLMHDKKNRLKQCSEEIRLRKLELSEFKQGCKILLKSIREVQGGDLEELQFLNDHEEIIYLMGELQKFFEKSYLSKAISVINKPKKEKIEPKRLTHLLTANQFQHYGTSIFEEKDLLEYARKNLEKLDKTQRVESSRVEK